VSRINVSFPLTKENGLNDGLIQIQCESIMFQVSGHSWEEVIVDETGQHIRHSSYLRSKYNSVYPSSTFPLVPASSSTIIDTNSINSNQWPAINERDLMAPPIINGLDKRYKIGDRLTVNCSAPFEGSTPSSYLMWMLNGREVC